MKNINRVTTAASFVLAALSLTTVAYAQTYYTSLTAFNAAATTGTLYDFEGIAPTANFSSNPAVLTVAAPGRITFSVTAGNDSTVAAVDSLYTSRDWKLSDGSDSVIAGRPFSNASTTRIDLDNLYTAFAIEYGMESNLTRGFTFGLFSGNTQIGTIFDAGSADGDRFFGATSSTAFDNVRVTAGKGSGYVNFDNARTGSIAVIIPEAGTFALVLPTLLVGVSVVRRRKR